MKKTIAVIIVEVFCLSQVCWAANVSYTLPNGEIKRLIGTTETKTWLSPQEAVGDNLTPVTNPDKAANWWEGMDIAQIISYLHKQSASDGAVALTELARADIGLAAKAIEGMDNFKAALIISNGAMSIEVAVAILKNVESKKIAHILIGVLCNSYSCGALLAVPQEKAAAILSAVSPDKAAEVLTAAVNMIASLTSDKNTNIITGLLGALRPAVAAKIIASAKMDTGTAAVILSKMDTKKVAAIFEVRPDIDIIIAGSTDVIWPSPGGYVISKEKAAAILSAMATDKAAQVLTFIATRSICNGGICEMTQGVPANPQRAAGIVGAMGAKAAAAIFASDAIDVKTAITILKSVDKTKTAAILTELAAIKPDKAKQIKEGLVLNWWEGMDVAHMAGYLDRLPLADAALALAVLVNTDPGLAAQVVSAVANGYSVCGSDGKFCAGIAGDPQQAADLLGALKPAAAALIIASDKMEVKTAVTILSKMDSPDIVNILNVSLEVLLKITPTDVFLPTPAGYMVSAQKAAAILSLLTTDKAAEVLSFITNGNPCKGEVCIALYTGKPDRAADILGAMEAKAASRIIASTKLDAKTAVLILSKIDSRKVAEIFKAATYPELWIQIYPAPAPSPVYLISKEKAAQILSLMTPDKAAEVLNNMVTNTYVKCAAGEKCAGFIDKEGIQRAADILGTMDVKAATLILNSDKLDVNTAVTILKGIENKDTVNAILGALDAINPDKAKQVRAGLDINLPWWEGMDLAGMISYLTNLAPDKAALALTELAKADVVLAAQALGGMDAIKAAYIIVNNNMSVDTAVKILSQMDSSKVARLLSVSDKLYLVTETTTDIYMPDIYLYSNKPIVNPDKSAAILSAMTADKAAGILSSMNLQTAAFIIGSINMSVETAINIFSKMDSQKAAIILSVGYDIFKRYILDEAEVTTTSTASILAYPYPYAPNNPIVSPDKAAAILSALTVDKAAGILAYMDPQAAASLIASGKMDTKKAANILSQMDPQRVAEIFKAATYYYFKGFPIEPVPQGGDNLILPINNYIISKEKAAQILSLMKPDVAATVLKYIATNTICNGDLCKVTQGIPSNPQRAADILGAMSPAVAAKIIASVHMDTKTAAVILSNMDPAKIAGIIGMPDPNIRYVRYDPYTIIYIISPQKAADILTYMAADRAAEVLSFLVAGREGGTNIEGVARAAIIIGLMDSNQAAQILASNKIDVAPAVSILKGIKNQATVTAILAALDKINPDKAKKIKEGLGLIPAPTPNPDPTPTPTPTPTPDPTPTPTPTPNPDPGPEPMPDIVYLQGLITAGDWGKLDEFVKTIKSMKDPALCLKTLSLVGLSDKQLEIWSKFGVLVLNTNAKSFGEKELSIISDTLSLLPADNRAGLKAIVSDNGGYCGLTLFGIVKILFNVGDSWWADSYKFASVLLHEIGHTADTTEFDALHNASGDNYQNYTSIELNSTDVQNRAEDFANVWGAYVSNTLALMDLAKTRAEDSDSTNNILLEKVKFMAKLFAHKGVDGKTYTYIFGRNSDGTINRQEVQLGSGGLPMMPGQNQQIALAATPVPTPTPAPTPAHIRPGPQPILRPIPISSFISFLRPSLGTRSFQNEPVLAPTRGILGFAPLIGGIFRDYQQQDLVNRFFKF